MGHILTIEGSHRAWLPLAALVTLATTALITASGAIADPSRGKDLCKDGGYQSLQYKNQGRCVSAANEAEHTGEPFPLTVRRAEIEPNNSLATPDPLPVVSDSFITGSIVPAGDRDFFRVIVAEDQSVRFETFVPTEPTCTDPPGTPTSDTVLRLYDAAGIQIAGDDDAGDGLCSLIVRNLAAGAYYIEVLEFQNWIGGTGRPIPAYTLEIDFAELPFS